MIPKAGLCSLALLSACQRDAVDVLLADENDYVYSGKMDVPSTVTASATDVTLNWDKVDSDLQCHALDAAQDVDNVGLVRFGHKDQPAVEEGMEDDSLQQADVDGYVEYHNDGQQTGVNLAELDFYGTPIDVPSEYAEGLGTYLLLLTTGLDAGLGARTVMFLEPRADSTNTRVDLQPGCGMLSLEVDLQSLSPVSIPAEGPWRFDWGGLTVDGQGNPIRAEAIDEVTFANYADLDAAGLQAQFFDIEELATGLWTYEAKGRTDFELDPDALDDGPDMSAPGLWLIALRCSTCYNPAPIFLTLIEVES